MLLRVPTQLERRLFGNALSIYEKHSSERANSQLLSGVASTVARRRMSTNALNAKITWQSAKLAALTELVEVQ